MLVLYDGSVHAQKALAITAQLAQAKEDGVVVVLLGETDEAVRDLRREATAWLADRGVIATYRWLSSVDAAKLCGS